MSDPINKAFLDEIEARLANITTDNGYNFTIKKIDRARLTPFKGYDLPAVNFWVTSVENKNTEYGIDTRSLSLFIEAHSKTYDLPFIDVCDKLAQDVVTSVYRSTLDPVVSGPIDQDLGGICEDLVFNRYIYSIGEGQAPFCAILAEFTIVYQVDQTKI